MCLFNVKKCKKSGEGNKINVHVCLHIKEIEYKNEYKKINSIGCLLGGVGNWVDSARVGRKFALFTFLYFLN